MTQKPKKRKDGKFFERFLRLFPAYRELEKTIRHKDDALRLSAAIIQTTKNDLAEILKKYKSDEALVESLNRYIETLENKDRYRSELLQEKSKEANDE